MNPPVVVAEVGTIVPIHVGAGARIELGPRLRFGVSGGILPDPYVGIINEVIELFWDDWTEDAQTLLDVALDNGASVRATAGWRPFPKLGFTTDLGYTFVGARGSTTTSELVAAYSGVTVEVPDSAPALNASATLHGVGIDFGWDQRLWRGLHLRAGLGWNYTFAATSKIEAEAAGGRIVAGGDYATEAEVYLNDTLVTYAHPATVTLMVGWAFGEK